MKEDETEIEGFVSAVMPAKNYFKIMLFDDPIVYYTLKDPKLEQGKTYKFIIRKGRGDFSGCYEILDAKLLNTNLALDKLPQQPGKQLVPSMVSLSIDDFKKLMDDRQVRNRSRLEALRTAGQVYGELVVRKELNQLNPEQIANDIIEIARKLEPYLV